MTAKTLFSCNIAAAFFSLIIASEFICGYGKFYSGTSGFFTQVIITFSESVCNGEIYMHAN